MARPRPVTNHLTPRSSAAGEPLPALQSLRRLSPAWLLAGVGTVSAGAAAIVDPGPARSAAAQDWPPFVLVTGLLLIGLVADEDRLFSAAGQRPAALARSGPILFVGAVALISTITAVLNLDTSVAFLTPVLIYTARSRGDDEAALIYSCILVSNAASLLLPGSNLTNLIVLGHLHLSGASFARRMILPWTAAVCLTAAVVALAERRHLRLAPSEAEKRVTPQIGLGLLAVAAATVLILVLPSPALPVAGVGIASAGIRMVGRQVSGAG
jgi:arsenical pump membrane protein